jgi:hypothetical protein
MQSLVQIEYFAGGNSVGGPFSVNQLTSNPDITDAFDVIEDAVRFAYHVGTFQWGSVVDDAQRFVADAMRDSNQFAKANSEVTWLAGGGVTGITGAVDEARILFRAWSEDDLQGMGARVDHSNPAAQINSLGERHYDENDNHFYESIWSVPLKTVPATAIVFDFTAGDDGWFFDVGHASFLSAKVISTFKFNTQWAASLKARNLIKTEDSGRKSKELNVVEGSLVKSKA